MIEKIHENHPESHCPDPNHVGCVMTQKFLSLLARGWVFDTSAATMDGLTSALSLLLPFMSTWFSNRSSDRVTQRTSMLESTSELLICFRNTWNWSGARLTGVVGSRLKMAKAQGMRSLQGHPPPLAQLLPTGRPKLRGTRCPALPT